MSWSEREAAAAAASESGGGMRYRFPMTLTQQAFWYLDRTQRGNPAWNIAVRFLVTGPLQGSLLAAALGAVAARQDALRTTFGLGDGPLDDTPVQLVHPWMPMRLPLYDLSSLTSERRAQKAEELTVDEARASFDLKEGPLVRGRLLRLAPEEHHLLLTVHHIIADGWSIGILARELMECYARLHGGQPPVLAPLPIQFADYAVWKAESASGAPAASDRIYWIEKLSHLPRCEVPTDYPRPAVSAHQGHILSTLLPASLTEALGGCARAEGATLYTAAMAALKLLLHRATGSTDVYVGTLVAGRDHVELEELIGVFVNTLVMRTELDPRMRFRELVRAVRATIEKGLTHQAMPFSQLMTQLRLKPERGCSHFYSINFIFQRDFVKPWQGAGLTVTALPSRSPGAIYDLNFFMVQRADGWRFSCEYDRELYAPGTVALLLEQFVAVLEQVSANPELPLSEVRLPSVAVLGLDRGAPPRYRAEP